MRGSKITYHVLSWYRQTQEREIQFLVSHREKKRPAYGEGIPERFIPEVEESKNAFKLTIGNAEKHDEGVYYCAVWFSNQYIFGEGTEIRVQDTEDAHRPHLTLLGPSAHEMYLHGSATFLCIATGFFPKSLRVKWLINNKSISVTFATVKNTDKTFKQTAGLTIPASLWYQGVNLTCVIEHETGVQSTSMPSSVIRTSFLESSASATEFFIECSSDILKLAARCMALSVSPRCALWLKHWHADNTSLVSIPFDGKLLFSKVLEDSIRKAAEGAKDFLPQERRRLPRAVCNDRRNFCSSFRDSRQYRPGREVARSSTWTGWIPLISHNRGPCLRGDNDHLEEIILCAPHHDHAHQGNPGPERNDS
ncbi:uncharacterized protein RCH25_043664 [Pelodytes ibericus]